MKLITLGTGAGNPSMTRNNSASYLEFSGRGYLIDAGQPLAASLVRKKIDFNAIRAVFLTHMHEDHFGGLTGFLKNRMVDGPCCVHLRKDWRGFWPEVWLPQQDAIEAFDALMKVQFRGHRRNRIQYHLIQPGAFYDDGFLKVAAIPNRHWCYRGEWLPSYCFRMEAEGKKLVCTGDLAADLSDFPFEAAEDADLVLCEFTHFDPMKCIDIFRKIHPRKLVFNHVARINEAIFPEFSKLFDYPMFVAKDGDEFEF